MQKLYLISNLVMSSRCIFKVFIMKSNLYSFTVNIKLMVLINKNSLMNIVYFL
jgi:hypothetical protein